jgi:hypothetical protein
MEERERGIIVDAIPAIIKNEEEGYRAAIVRAFRGSTPAYTNEAFDFLKSKGFGYYVGGHVDEWRWEREGSACWKIPYNELVEIYLEYSKKYIHKEL